MIDKKILVVEQDVESRSKFYEIFFNKGYQVHCVPTAKEAFAVMTEQRFSIILMAYQLPDLSGTEAIRKIREFDEESFIVLLHDQELDNDQGSAFSQMKKVRTIKKDFSSQDMMRSILELIRQSDSDNTRADVSPNYTKASVLVVDDNNEIRQTLELFLQKRGYNVRTAVSGEDALMKIRTEKPDIVCLDFRMPGMDGVMALRQIKRLDDSINVIMLTSVQDEYIVDEAKREGAFGYLVKPCDLSRLETMIKSILLK